MRPCVKIIDERSSNKHYGRECQYVAIMDIYSTIVINANTIYFVLPSLIHNAVYDQ